MRRWKTAVAGLAAALLATGMAMPAHAQVAVFEGQGQMVLTFTAAGEGLSFTDVTVNCLPYNITGTGVIEFSIGSAVYAGPITVTGTWSACGDATTLNEGDIAILITGDPLLGDFGCGGGPFGTDMPGVLIGTGPITEGGTAGVCHIGAATTPTYASIMLPGVRTVSAVTTSPLTATGYTETVPFTAAPV
jgi:hypothetical protein